MPEDLTIVIGNLGDLKNLRACLSSIFGTISGKCFLRVIVGFNFEGESEIPRTLASEFPQVEQVRANVRLGYCRAYNQLMARSSGRYILLLDDDTVLHSDTIYGMIAFMDAHPEVGIAGCRTVKPDRSYQKSTGLMYNMKTELINVFRPAAFWNDGIDEFVTTWKSVGWLCGHFLMVRPQVIKQVGMLDENFYTFQCEADWCLRISRAGWKIAYVPDFTVTHIGGVASGASDVKSYRNLIRTHINRYYFIRKHYGNAALFLFRAIMTSGVALRLLSYVVLWVLNPARRPEAGPKIEAYSKIILLGAKRNPENAPDDFRRENEASDVFRPVTIQ